MAMKYVRLSEHSEHKIFRIQNLITVSFKYILIKLTNLMVIIIQMTKL